MSVLDRRREATRLGRYWNALVRGTGRQELSQLSAGIDRELLGQIEVVRRGHDLQVPDQQFVARLEHELLRAISSSDPRAEATSRWTVTHYGGALPEPGRPPYPGGDLAGWTGRRIGVAAVATVVVLLVLVAGLTAVFDDPEPQALPFRAVDPNTPIAITPAPTEPPRDIESLNGIAELIWTSAAIGSGYPGFTNIDREGRIWAIDGATDRFVIFASDGTQLDSWGTTGSGQGQFVFSPGVLYDVGDVAFAPDGRFYVTDPGNRRVQVFDADRQFLFSWGDEGDGSGDGQFQIPASVAIAPDGTILVSDVYRNDVQRFSADGAYLGRFETPQSSADRFTEAGGITIAPDGTIWVLGVADARIHRFNADGTFLDTIGDSLGGPIVLDRPWEVAFDADGNAHVANSQMHRITVFARDGTYLAEWGTRGSEPGEFTNPGSIAIAGDTAYVTEYGSNRIQAFRITLPIAPTATPVT